MGNRRHWEGSSGDQESARGTGGGKKTLRRRQGGTQGQQEAAGSTGEEQWGTCQATGGH